METHYSYVNGMKNWLTLKCFLICVPILKKKIEKSKSLSNAIFERFEAKEKVITAYINRYDIWKEIIYWNINWTTIQFSLYTHNLMAFNIITANKLNSLGNSGCHICPNSYDICNHISYESVNNRRRRIDLRKRIK